MSVALPYRFDTSDVVATVVRGAVALLLVVVVGAAYTLIVSRRPAAAAGLAVVAALIAYFARLFARNLTGTTGTITPGAVTVRPVRVLGIRLAGQEGTYPLHRFTSVRVERASPPIEGPGGPHARVYLAGRDTTPDILIARADLDDGLALGRELAAVVRLPLEETSVPY